MDDRGRAAAAVLMAGIAIVSCADRESTTPPIGETELAAVLLTEADDIGLSAFGPFPMTSSDPDSADFYQDPPSRLCDSASHVEFVAPDDLYAYLGDGGDYLYAYQWATGEPEGDAVARFAKGVEALDSCVDSGDLVTVDQPRTKSDEVQRYAGADAHPTDEDDRVMVIYARKGGVILLHVFHETRGDRRTDAERDHHAQVVLDKLDGVNTGS